jgi:hypothetical protein
LPDCMFDHLVNNGCVGHVFSSWKAGKQQGRKAKRNYVDIYGRSRDVNTLLAPSR